MVHFTTHRAANMDSIISSASKLAITNSVKLSYDEIHEILKRTNIGYVTETIRNLGSHLDMVSQKDLEYRRLDPRLVFTDLEIDGSAVMRALMASKVVISGSRCTNYFVPGSCSPTSDYDFYAEDSEESIYAFVFLMSDLGVKWKFSELADPYGEDSDEMFYTTAKFQLLRGVVGTSEGNIDVQLIWRLNCSASQSIIQFHSTAPQCFISGFAAVSLYHSLTKERKSVSWYLNDVYKEQLGSSAHTATASRSFVEQEERNAHAVQKYKDKGFVYVNDTCNDKKIGPVGGIMRHIGDDKSCVIPLYNYSGVESGEGANGQAADYSDTKEYYNKCTDRLKYIMWLELDGKTVLLPSGLDKYTTFGDTLDAYDVDYSEHHTIPTALRGIICNITGGTLRFNSC